MHDIQQSVRLIAMLRPEPGLLFEDTPERVIEYAGRICYKSEDKIGPGSDTKLIETILKPKRHFSVIEHSATTWHFITDRGITHELVRMRIASYSQESTRYVNYTKDKHGAGDIGFIHPLGLTEEQMAFSLRAYEIEQNLYNEAIRLGMTPQQARDYLPNGVKTEIVMTTNWRELLHIFDLRTDDSSHPKMRALMGMAADIMAVRHPVLFKEANKQARNLSAILREERNG